jgi:hypothetical protein
MKSRLFLKAWRVRTALKKSRRAGSSATASPKELVLLDDDLKVTQKIPCDSRWIQDCTRLPNGNILLNDVDKHILVEFPGPPWEITNNTPYDQNWRMGELVIVPAAHEHAFTKIRRRSSLAFLHSGSRRYLSPLGAHLPPYQVQHEERADHAGRDKQVVVDLSRNYLPPIA